MKTPKKMDRQNQNSAIEGNVKFEKLQTQVANT
jgi:hypothetical protein